MHTLLLALALAAPPDTPKAKSPLDDMIASALKNHPDVRAAEAKKLLAEAELEQARLLITQKVSAAASRVEMAKAKLVEAEDSAVFAEKLFKNTAASEAEKVQFAKARPALLAAKAELAAAELELQLLVGKKATDDVTPADKADTFAGKLPTGPVAEKLEAAAKRMVNLNLKEVKLEAALASLIGGEGEVLIRGPKAATNLISVQQKSPISFGAAVELLMDEFNLANPGNTYQVYVREYGLLIELKGGIAPKDAMTLPEFLSAIRAKPR